MKPWVMLGLMDFYGFLLVESIMTNMTGKLAGIVSNPLVCLKQIQGRGDLLSTILALTWLASLCRSGLEQ